MWRDQPTDILKKLAIFLQVFDAFLFIAATAEALCFFISS
jgi:hypothetical protein